MEELKRIAAIHDLSGLGKCSLTVALPIISASGVECSCMPTAILSTHTGEFTGFTFRDLSDDLLAMAEHWRSTGARFDGIYSGYMANAAQVGLLEEIIGVLAAEETLIIVDPVMADNGKYYSKMGDDMCRAFRKLCARAHIITPNVTEAALLTDMPYVEGPHTQAYIDELLGKLSELCHGSVTVTGVCPDSERVGAVALDTRTGRAFGAFRKHEEGSFHGTGDIFASAFSALIVRGVDTQTALETSISLVGDCISRTVSRGAPRRFGVDFESALPGYVLAVAKLFG